MKNKILYYSFFLVMVMARGPAGNALGGPCANAQPESMIADSGKSKCGFGENCDVSTPPRIYLTQDVEVYKYCLSANSEGAYEGEYNLSDVDTYDHLSCSDIDLFSCYGDAGGTEFWETETNGVLTGGENEGLNGEVDGSYGGIRIDVHYYGGDISTNGTCTSQVETYYENGSASIDDANYAVTLTSTTTLSQQYTDEMLRGDLITLMPPYPTNWSVGASSAYYTLSSDHETGNGQRMKYRFHVTDCVQGVSYLVKWDEVTSYPGSSQAPSIAHLSEKVAGNGDMKTGVYTSVREKDVPGSPSSIGIANWTVIEIPSGGGRGGGGGGGGGPPPGNGGPSSDASSEGGAQ